MIHDTYAKFSHSNFGLNFSLRFLNENVRNTTKKTSDLEVNTTINIQNLKPIKEL